MKTQTIKFTREFYAEIPQKKTHLAGATLDIPVDEENFPIHSFWQSQFLFNDLTPAFELVNDVDSKVTSDKPKKAN